MIYAFGEFEIDEEARELRNRGAPQPIEPKAFDLLVHLVRHRERLVTKRELLDTLWSDAVVSEGSLTRAVNLARSAVGDSGHDQRIIKTLSGRGYRFVAAIGERETRVPDRSRARTGLVAGLALLGAFGVGLWASWPAALGILLYTAGLRPPPVNPAPPERPSIVVLPFDDLSENGSRIHVVDGFTDDLTFELGHFSELFVISRHSAFTYQDRPRRLRDIAKELGVRYAVEGSLRMEGQRVVVSAHLIEAETERQLWSGRFDRQIRDLLDLQAEISEEISGALGVHIREAELARTERKPNADLGAYELVVRGLSHWYRLTREDHRAAQDLFRRAIEIDPRDARAHALLSSSLLANYAMGWEPDLRYVEQGRRLAERAIELDPHLSTAYAALAGAELFSGNLDAAVAAADRAVELGPNSDMCHGVRAMSLASKGKPFAAIAALNQALRLNPRHAAPYWMLLGYMYERSGRRDQALEIWERVRAANPDMVLPRLELAQVYEGDGRHEEAADLIREILAASPRFDSELAERLAPSGLSAAEAQARRERLERAGLPAS